ncbi:hypothetical protein LP420_06920 [Massilia sp. B-10]|nr:hypothetical protein LP420_06920 [Massilia sp. B-10]
MTELSDSMTDARRRRARRRSQRLLSIAMTQRQTWLDVLKGIGILTVVVGHISFNRNLVGLIQMFHMPLFFLA